MVGSIGRFTKQKGIEYFLSAAKELAARLPKARFVLIGDGELRGKTEGLIAQYDLGNRCLVVRAVDGFSSYYPVFDVFVLTSLWEGMPYAMLEAMAASRAVVAFGSGGIPDVISDGENGMLVEPKNVEGLIDVIATLGEGSQKRNDLGLAARQVVAKDYTLEAMVQRIEQAYIG